jgi:hypothetical protein
MLRTCSILVLGGLILACVEPEPPKDTPPPAYFVTILQASDSRGVGSVACPAESRITGGGCHCRGIGDPLFGAAPAGNSFVCGCYGDGAVLISANCLSSSHPNTLRQGLSAPSPEALMLIEEFRAAKGLPPRSGTP